MSNHTHLDVDTILNNLSNSLQSYIDDMSLDDYVFIGIHTGGVWVANAIRERISSAAPMGELNIAFYRDDFSQIGMHPTVQPSNLPFSVEGKNIILIDDVLYTGRTIRAAMNELFDYGRPKSIHLAVLIERNGSELPIQADVVGESITLKPDEHVKLSGPTPLGLVFKSE